MRRTHTERHLIQRVGWLRAAVLGANDGIISTASLIVGVAAASQDHQQILVAGIAGILAGSMSMAAGEFVSVSSQSDAEESDLKRERRELEENPSGELTELAQIYMKRGVEQAMAYEVARQLMAKDALAVHAREELGISEITTARPYQAAFTSALTFAAGAVLPLIVAVLSPIEHVIPSVFISSMVSLGLLGAAGAKAGGAHMGKGTFRVLFWGAIAMLLTALIGQFFNVAV